MKKLLEVVCLLSLILLLGSFITIKALSLGPTDNWFNKNYRAKIAVIPKLRQVFALNQDGDAKSDYLSERRESIILEIDETKGYEFLPESLAIAKEQIQDLTGKKVVIIHSSEIPPDKLEYSQVDLAEIYNRYKLYKTDTKTAVFYIVTVPLNKDDAGIVGTTLMADGSAIFLQGIDNLGSLEKAAIEASTILHEFGHILGLPHLLGPDCIMNETLELGTRKQNIATEFCQEEIQVFEEIMRTVR